MALIIEPLTEALLPSYREFAERVWNRPRTESYYQWRYRDAPGQLTFVAHQNGICLGSVSAFRRPYCFGGNQVDCLETFDWFCAPDIRVPGVGVRVMRELMELGLPIVALGGSAEALALLPRLGFELAAMGQFYSLPLSGASLRQPDRQMSVSETLTAAALDIAGPLFFGWGTRRGGVESYLVPQSTLDEFAYTVDEPPALRALPHRPHIEWLTRGFPDLGSFVPFGFIDREQRLGWALARLYRRNDRLFGILLDLRYSAAAVPRLPLLVQSIVATLRGMGAVSVVTTTTCAAVGAALCRRRFLRRGPVPALIWPGAHKLPDEAVRISLLRGDGGMLPLPTAAESLRGAA
jgi:hypothetical protein